MDLVGALLILPVPLAATIQGEFKIENSEMLKILCIVLISKNIRIIPHSVYLKLSRKGFSHLMYAAICIINTYNVTGQAIGNTAAASAD